MDVAEGIGMIFLVIAIALLAVLFGGWLVMVIYNGLDLNLLVNGPDMEYKQGLGVALILGAFSASP